MFKEINHSIRDRICALRLDNIPGFLISHNIRQSTHIRNDYWLFKTVCNLCDTALRSTDIRQHHDVARSKEFFHFLVRNIAVIDCNVFFNPGLSNQILILPFRFLTRKITYDQQLYVRDAFCD